MNESEINNYKSFRGSSLKKLKQFYNQPSLFNQLHSNQILTNRKIDLKTSLDQFTPDQVEDTHCLHVKNLNSDFFIPFQRTPSPQGKASSKQYAELSNIKTSKILEDSRQSLSYRPCDNTSKTNDKYINTNNGNQYYKIDIKPLTPGLNKHNNISITTQQNSITNQSYRKQISTQTDYQTYNQLRQNVTQQLEKSQSYQKIEQLPIITNSASAKSIAQISFLFSSKNKLAEKSRSIQKLKQLQLVKPPPLKSKSREILDALKIEQKKTTFRTLPKLLIQPQ